MPKTKTNTKSIIHIAADHRGYILKYELKKYLQKNNFKIIDHGNHEYQVRDDYPDFAKALCKTIQKKPSDFGILICGSGIGMAIVANRYSKIRAANCWHAKVAISARNDDDANILVLPADFITKTQATETVKKFLHTKFSAKTKHIRRLKKI